MKNILLFFLSNIHLDSKTHAFTTSRYEGKDGKIFECVQTNEPAVDYMMDILEDKLDALFFFSSKKTKEMLQVVENGCPAQKTHVGWFTDRIISKYPELKDSIYVVDYDEDKDTDESIRQVTAMIEQIKSYHEGKGNEDICIHADMTGGFRHASMMMLSVLQLLDQYKGFKIEKILYSNWQGKKKANMAGGKQNIAVGVIEEVTELHRMFTLVSGTDEFVNFGSVKEIDRYFEKRKKSPELDALLDTMRDFSDAIKTCRTNKIEKVVEQLQSRINAFSDAPKETVHEEIFAQIITVLREEYGRLLSPEVTSPEVRKIEIIEWCIHKGFLQQAMTLCTEWLPALLVKKKICYTDNAAVKLEALKRGQPKNRTWEGTFIIDYYKGTPAVIDLSGKKGYFFAVQHFIDSKDGKESAALFEEGKEPLLQLFTECKMFPDIFREIKMGKKPVSLLKNATPMLSKASKILWEQRCNTNQTNLRYEDFLKEKIIDTDHLLRQIVSLSLDYYSKLVGVSAEVLAGPEPDSAAVAGKSRWEGRKVQYLSMYDRGIMKSNYSCDEMIELLQGYYVIREERNRINHAASEEEKDERETLRKPPEMLMLDYLEVLKKY